MIHVGVPACSIFTKAIGVKDAQLWMKQLLLATLCAGRASLQALRMRLNLVCLKSLAWSDCDCPVGAAAMALPGFAEGFS